MAPTRNRRPGFSRRAQYGVFLGYVIAVAGSLVGAVLLLLASLDPIAFAAFRATLAEGTTPLSTAAAAVARGIDAVPRGIDDHFRVEAQNADLRRQLGDLHGLLMRARTLAYDNLRLRQLLRVRDRVVAPGVTARLVSSSASSTRRFAILNAGSFQNVRVGQPVRGPDGLVGRVLEVGPDSARILLLSDPESIVPVRRTRDGLAALVAGRGDGMLDVRSVNVANAAFQPGDVFVTSGTGGIYAPGVPVARIVRRARDIALGQSFAAPDSFDYAFVEPAFMPAAAQPAVLPARTPAAAAHRGTR